MRTTNYHFLPIQLPWPMKLPYVVVVLCLGLSPLLVKAQDSDKKFNSKRNATAELVKPHSEIGGIYRIINPTHRGKVRNNTEACKAFLAQYHPRGEWTYLFHIPQKGKKRPRYTEEIIVLDSSRDLHILDPDDMEKLVKFLLRHMECGAIRPILKDALTNASTGRIVLILARLVCDESLRTFAYQQYFATFNHPKAVWEGLRQISKPDGQIRDLAARAAAATVNSEALLLEYFKYFKGSYHDLAFQHLAQANSCDSVLDLLEREPVPKQLKDIRLPNLERVEVECIQTTSDFLAYLAKYPGGTFHELAAKKLAALLLGDCQLVGFIKTERAVAARFRAIFLPQAVECIQEVEDCIQLNEVYRQEEDIQLVLEKATNQFPLKNLVQLIEHPTYSPFKKELEPLFFAGIGNINDVDIFLNHFSDASEEHLQRVFLRGMQFAEQDSNLAQLATYLNKYLAKGWSYDDVQEFLDCRTIMTIADTRQETRNTLHDPILRCVGTDTLLFDGYLDLYPGNKELLASETVAALDAKEAMFFFRKYDDPGGHIERHFPKKVRTVEDVDFYFTSFPNSPFLQEALEKGILLAEQTEQKFRMLKRYFDKFGYQQANALTFLEDCRQRIAFASTYATYRDSVCLLSQECVRDIVTAKEIRNVCGIPLTELGIDQLVFDSLQRAVNQPSLSTTFDLIQPTEEIVSWSRAGLELAAITMEAPKKSFPFELSVKTGDSTIQFRLDKDQPVKFFDFTELPEGETITVFLRSGGRKTSEAKLHLVNFPKMLEISFLQHQFYDATSRGALVRALDQVRDQNAREDFHRTLVRPDIYEVLTSSATISESQLNGLIQQLAYNYVLVYDKIPKGWREWPSRKWGSVLEILKRD